MLWAQVTSGDLRVAKIYILKCWPAPHGPVWEAQSAWTHGVSVVRLAKPNMVTVQRDQHACRMLNMVGVFA